MNPSISQLCYWVLDKANTLTLTSTLDTFFSPDYTICMNVLKIIFGLAILSGVHKIPKYLFLTGELTKAYQCKYTDQDNLEEKNKKIKNNCLPWFWMTELECVGCVVLDIPDVPPAEPTKLEWDGVGCWFLSLPPPCCPGLEAML